MSGLHLGRRAADIAERLTAEPPSADLISFADADDHELLRDSVCAGACRVHLVTWKRWRREGLGPRFIRVGPRAVRTRKSDLLAWLKERATERAAREGASS